MANAKTNIAGLIDEVADLLRHDNLDVRITNWLFAAFNDMCTRASSPLFARSHTVAFGSGNEDVAVGTADWDDTPSNPIIAIFVSQAPSVKIFLPRYVSMLDYARVAHYQEGTALESGFVPLVWTLGPSDTEIQGRARMFVYPKPATSYDVTLLTTGRTQYHDSLSITSAGFLPIPYHLEHVVVWGAAAFGAKLLRPELYPLYKGEYEKALQQMYWIADCRPDAVPVLRSVTSPYGGTPLTKGMPRFPSTIG